MPEIGETRYLVFNSLIEIFKSTRKASQTLAILKGLPKKQTFLNRRGKRLKLWQSRKVCQRRKIKKAARKSSLFTSE
jgi:hypothetical protein